jgi:soluble lytic murein transglycosylase
VALRFGLDPWLVAAVARQESVFVPTARSPAGAVGLLQLVPGTARRHALALGLGPRPELTDPELNLLLGARELAALLDRFGAVEPALAAYNAGEARARRWWRAWPERRRFVEAIPIPETYTYVRRVVHLAEAYRVVYADPRTPQDGGGG